MAVRVLQYSDVENAYDRPERIGRLAGLVGERRDEDTLVVGTGDTTAPGVLSLVSEGRQALAFFERVAPDLETFGNHDFDHGTGSILGIVTDSPQTWVATNVYRPDTDPPDRIDDRADRFGADAGVVPTAIREIDGTRLGFVGVLDPATPDVTPTAADLVVTDPVEATRRATTRLRARGVDAVIVLSHVGRGDAELARRTDVDVVLGGHVHSLRLERIDGTVLTRPGSNARRVIELRFDAGEWTAAAHDVPDAPVDEGVADALRGRLSAAGLDEVVATAPSPIERSDATVAGACRIGRFIAESYRWATDADVGLQNSGGIRSGPPLDGDVTAADLVSLVPFREPVVLIELSGRALRDVLRERDGSRLDIVPDDRWMGHVSGVRRREGRFNVGDEPLDPDATYTLATSAFLCYTDDEFPTLTGRDPVARTDRTQYEVLVDYARDRGLDGVRDVTAAGTDSGAVSR